MKISIKPPASPPGPAIEFSLGGWGKCITLYAEHAQSRFPQGILDIEVRDGVVKTLVRKLGDDKLCEAMGLPPKSTIRLEPYDNGLWAQETPIIDGGTEAFSAKDLDEWRWLLADARYAHVKEGHTRLGAAVLEYRRLVREDVRPAQT